MCMHTVGDFIQGTGNNFLLVKYITQIWLSAKQTCKEISQLAIELPNCAFYSTQSLFSMLAISIKKFYQKASELYLFNREK